MVESVDATQSIEVTINAAYPLHWRRWPVVFILALINGMNGLLWLSYVPILNHFVTFYSTNKTVFSWIQVSFAVTTVVLCIPITLFIESFGIRSAIIVSAILNMICCILRVLSSALSNWPTNFERLVLVATAHVIASIGQPICMFTPTKLAADWFPVHHRTVANTIGSFGNMVGKLICHIFVPLIVYKPEQIDRLNDVILAAALFSLILSAAVVTRAEPANPPTATAAIMKQARLAIKTSNRLGTIRRQLTQFRKFLITPFRHLEFCFLMLVFGFNLGYVTVISSLFQEMLCVRGYSAEFARLCVIVLVLVGVIMSIVVAVLVDKFNNLFLITKLCYALSVLGAISYGVLLWFTKQQIPIIVSLGWLGAFAFAHFGLCLEAAAEATFPVPESITTGLLISFSQLLSIILIPLMQATAPYLEQTPVTLSGCGPHAKPQDYTIPNIVLCALFTITAVLQLFFLRLPYKRRDAGKAAVSAATKPPSPTAAGITPESIAMEERGKHDDHEGTRNSIHSNRDASTNALDVLKIP